MKILTIVSYLLLFALLPSARGQEHVAPIRCNPMLYNKAKNRLHTARTTAVPLSLPFFEDFTNYGVYPDSTKWVDFEVFINNTMGAGNVSRGVATFDDLTANGIPYDSFSNSDFRYADSLTSQPIDLSSNTSADSLYLSFFYQPAGNGFYPLPQDSLMLYMKTIFGGYVKVWSVAGSAIQPFQQVMIPITDSFYFHSSFQFRFVNIAALYWADAVWNVDYIRLDQNRSAIDTAVNDVAFNADPSFLLNDFTSMPYWQFTANPLSETVTQVMDSLRNSSLTTQFVNYSFSVKDMGSSGMSLFTAGSVPVSIGPSTTTTATDLFSIPTLPSYPMNTLVDFQSQFYIQNTPGTGPTVNDTIIKQQVFDNYLAYDDGSAEKSYYLNLFSTLSGLIEVEYHLNQPDTMQGMAIYFGRQIPFAYNKIFSINVYSSLAGVNGASSDHLLYQTDLLNPQYFDSINHFWYYRFDTPLVLPAGTFYAGTEQCAECGSDSLYFGLDVNRIGSNHAYYNVLGNWNPSLISGAIMMRPVLGKFVPGTGIAQIKSPLEKWRAIPNPANDYLEFDFNSKSTAAYRITDITGQTLMQGTVTSGSSVDISKLPPGMYLANLSVNGIAGSPQKIVKL